jgi:hypothetical protein
MTMIAAVLLLNLVPAVTPPRSLRFCHRGGYRQVLPSSKERRQFLGRYGQIPARHVTTIGRSRPGRIVGDETWRSRILGLFEQVFGGRVDEALLLAGGERLGQGGQRRGQSTWGCVVGADSEGGAAVDAAAPVDGGRAGGLSPRGQSATASTATTTPSAPASTHRAQFGRRATSSGGIASVGGRGATATGTVMVGSVSPAAEATAASVWWPATRSRSWAIAEALW